MLTLSFALIAAASGADMQATTGRDASAASDPDRVVCRRSEPITGTRTATRRVCKTVAEWQAFEQDRAQFRRDLLRGARSGEGQRSE